MQSGLLLLVLAQLVLFAAAWLALLGDNSGSLLPAATRPNDGII